MPREFSSKIGVMQGRLVPPEHNRIQSFPVTNWREEIVLAGSLGIPLIEWTLDKAGLFENPILTRSGLDEVISLCANAGVAVNSATADNLMQAPIHKKGPEGSTPLGEVRDLIGRLGDAGIELVVWPLVDSGNVAGTSEIEGFLAQVESLTPILKASGVSVVFETDLSASGNHRLLAALDEEVFGLNLDIGNMACYGHSVTSEFECNAQRIRNVHIKDRLRHGTTVPLGSGDVDWPAVAGALRRYYSGSFVLQAARGEDDVQAVKDYLAFCRAHGIGE
jgi:L-ribulose-5-phosphate 3-epimerase